VIFIAEAEATINNKIDASFLTMAAIGIWPSDARRMGSIPSLGHPNPSRRRRLPSSSFRPVTAVTSPPPMETSPTTEPTAKDIEHDLGLT
jgi:hypothetical protein